MQIYSSLYPNLPRFLTVEEYAVLTKNKRQCIYNRIWQGKQLGVLHDSGHKPLIDVDVALRPKPPADVAVESSSG